MTDEPREEASEEEDELEAKLRAIDERVQEIRGGSKLPDVPEWEYKRRPIPGQPSENDKGFYFGLGIGLTVAYTIIGLTAAGWFVGWLIDRQSNGIVGQAAGVLIGAVLGLAGGIYMLVRAQERNQ